MCVLISKAKDVVSRGVSPALFMRFVAWHDYFFAEPDLRVLSDLVIPGTNAIDVGANYGVYSYYLSHLASRVYAYEPNQRLAARLKKAVSANVAVIEAGLSDHVGTAVLTVPYIDGRQIHGFGTIEDHAFDGQISQARIVLKRLDDEQYENIGFIKIDVEGHEEAVIRGALGLISRCHPRLLVEIEQRHLRKSVRDVVGYIESLGYRTCAVQAGSNRRKAVYREIPASDMLSENNGRRLPCNYLFIHKQDSFCRNILI